MRKTLSGFGPGWRSGGGMHGGFCGGVLCGLMAVAVAPSLAFGSIVIDVGDHFLVPNTAGQTIVLLVSGSEPVDGLNLNVQVADGGPGVGGMISGPSITSVDLLTGTIFAPNHTAPQDPGSFPQLAIRTVNTSSGAVLAAGQLVTLTVSTVGFVDGTWELKLSDTLNGPTDFAGVPATITDGSITLRAIPEPNGILGLLLPAALPVRRRR
jgi:hypothetical protein